MRGLFTGEALIALEAGDTCDFDGAPELGDLDPLAKPTALEMAIPPERWNLLIPSGAGQPLMEAAERLQSYLKGGMRTHVNIEQRASLAAWSACTGAEWI